MRFENHGVYHGRYTEADFLMLFCSCDRIESGSKGGWYMTLTRMASAGTNTLCKYTLLYGQKFDVRICVYNIL